MIDQKYQKFESQIENLLLSLDLQENKEETKKNILASLYFNYLNAILGSEANEPLVQKLKASESLDANGFNNLIEEGKKLLSNSGVDFEKTFEDSCEAVLKDFVSELEPKLPAENVAE